PATHRGGSRGTACGWLSRRRDPCVAGSAIWRKGGDRQRCAGHSGGPATSAFCAGRSRMKLHSLRVEQLRCFRQPFVLDGLAPGINVVTGPNGAGKSTLVRAIRAAFLERYRSSSVDDLSPEGDNSAGPTIELTF